MTTQVIAATRFTAQNTVTISNPVSYAAGDGWLSRYGVADGTKLADNGTGATGPNCVLSIGPDGSFQARPAGTAGGWETCKCGGGLAEFSGTGNCFTLPCQSL